MRSDGGHGADGVSGCPAAPIGVGLVALTVLAIGGAAANGLRYDVPESATATITLTDVPSNDGQRHATADVQLTPANLVSDDPNWVSVLGWQGGLANDRGIFVDNLENVGPGHFRSTEPMPVSGEWKTLLRLHDGRTFAAVPIYLAGDPGIGAKEVPAEASTTRPFVARDHHPAARAQPRHPPVLVAHRLFGRAGLHAGP